MQLVAEDKRQSAVSYVIANIKRWILTKKLKPGDRLPSESELSKLLSTSRGSIREAMKNLSAFRIIQIRQGDGTYVSTTVGSVPFDPLLFSLILTEAETHEILELRESIEIIVVKLIIKNAGEDDLERLKEVPRALEDRIAMKADRNEIIARDLEFHATMAEICGNRLIEKIYGFIMEFLQPTIRGEGVVPAHGNILDALLRRDVEKAVKAIILSHDPWERGLPVSGGRFKVGNQAVAL